MNLYLRLLVSAMESVRRLGWFGQKKSKRLERTEGNEFEFHHAGLAQRKRFKKCTRLAGVAEIQDEHDASFIRLVIPLIDFPGKVEARSGADFRWQNGGY